MPLTIKVSIYNIRRTISSIVSGVNLLSNIVSVVRTSDDHTPEITEEDLEKKLSPAEEETQLESLMEHQVDKFMDNHVIRLKLPEGITAGLTNSNKGRSYSIAGNALDISLARMFSIVEGKCNDISKKFEGSFKLQKTEIGRHDPSKFNEI